MSAWIDNTKSFASALRDVVITGILFLLVFWPTTMNRSLIAAGFTEGDIGGFKWKAAVQDNTQKLSAAADTINNLQEHLGRTQAALQTTEQSRQKLAEEVAATAPESPAAKAATAPPPVPTTQIVQQNNQLVNRSQVYEERLREQVKANQQLLATVPSR